MSVPHGRKNNVLQAKSDSRKRITNAYAYCNSIVAGSDKMQHRNHSEDFRVLEYLKELGSVGPKNCLHVCMQQQ